MSDDLIKRSDAIAELWDMTTEDCPNPGAAVGKCMEAIRHLPSADIPSAVDLSSVYSTAYKSGYEKGKADRPQGEWVDCKGG